MKMNRRLAVGFLFAAVALVLGVALFHRPGPSRAEVEAAPLGFATVGEGGDLTRWAIGPAETGETGGVEPAVLTDTPVPGGTINSDTTWTLGNSPYVVQGNLTVNANVTLTIQPGVLVRLADNANLTVNGTLSALGTVAQPITFTANANRWGSLFVYGTARLEHLDIGLGANNLVHVQTSAFEIKNSRVHHSSGVGVYVESSSRRPLFQNVTVENNAGDAIRQQSMMVDARYQNVTLQGNTGAHGDAVVLPGGTVDGPTTLWGGPGYLNAPYVVSGGNSLASTGSLTITAGTELRLGSGVWLVVSAGSTLTAVGTPASPIVFAGTASPPAAGSWSHVDVVGTARLEYVDMGYGGQGSARTLSLRSSDVQVRNSRVHHGAGQGISVAEVDNPPLLENVIVEDNAGDAIFQDSLSIGVRYVNVTLRRNGSDAVVTNGASTNRQVIVYGGQDALNGAPYSLRSSVSLLAGGVLTFTAGTEVRFPANGWLIANPGSVLSAVGTPTRPITFTGTSPSPGSWGSIQVWGTGRLEYVDIGYGGTGPARELYLRSSDVQVRNSRVHHSAGPGISMAVVDNPPVLENVVVENNAGYAIWQDSYTVGAKYVNVTLRNNGTDAVAVSWGYVDRNTTLYGGWEALNGSPYLATGSFSIVNGAVLTLTAGTELQFSSGGWLAESAGTGLIAIGTPTQPITFTAAGNPSPGAWVGLNALGGRTRLEYVDIGYAGASGTHAIAVQSTSFEMRNSRVHDSAGRGIEFQVAAATPMLENVAFEDNAGAAVYVATPNMSPSFVNLTLARNGANAIQIQGGGITAGRFWSLARAGAPVHVLGSLTLVSGQFLWLEPGTSLAFPPQAVIDTMGTFYALGTVTAPITLTSQADTPGTWRGIWLRSSGKALLQYVDLRNGGQDGYPLLGIIGGRAVVQNSRIHGSASEGLLVEYDVAPTITQNSIYGNAFGLRNGTPETTVVDARNNWWGSASGPRHASNPGGTGDEVSEGVLFDPWLGAPPSTTPPPGRTEVQVAGPRRVAPGQTVDYAIAYANLLNTTVQDAVLVAGLPGTASLVDTTGGGIYWAGNWEVFWKLGNLPPGASGVVSLRVKYQWGIADNSPDGIGAILAGSNVLTQTLDVAPYLAYTADTLLEETVLSDAEVQQERLGYPGLDQLYQQAVAEGYTRSMGTRLVLSTGRVITEIVLADLSRGSAVYLQREGSYISEYRINPTTFGIASPTGGITINLALMTDEIWGTWASAPPSGLAPAHDVSPYEGCMYNCMNNKIGLQALGQLIRKVGDAINIDQCRKCVTGGGLEPCGKCLAWIVRAHPAVAASLSLKACNDDCRVNPEKWYCTEDKTTCKWSGLGQLGPFPLGTWLAYKKVCLTETHSWEHGYRVDVCGVEEVSCNEDCKRVWKPVPCLSSKGSGKGCQRCTATTQGTVSTCAGGVSAEGLCCEACDNPCTCVVIPKDPNAKYGPAGDVVPGQLITYTITYENVGVGQAFGVYVTDELSENLDESTLTIYGGDYLPATRTIFWSIGELAPQGEVGSSGTVSFTVRLKNGLPSGTVVINQAVVNFPSVPEVTPTNAVVNVVQPLAAIPQTVRTTWGQPVSITLRGSDASGSALSYAVDAEPGRGTLSGAAPNLVYTPAGNFTGVDTLSFTVSNATTRSRPAEVQIYVDSSAADNIAPAVWWTEPRSGAVVSGITATPILTDTQGPIFAPYIVVQFSEPISATTVTTQTVLLTDSGNQPIPRTVTYDGTANQLILVPRQALPPAAAYSVTLLASITDLAGNPLAADYRWSFQSGGGVKVYLPLTVRGGGW